MSSFPTAPREQLTRWQWRALGVGVAALVICALGALMGVLPFLRAYLVAYLFVLGIAHGCLVVLMIYHLTGGAWGFLIRRVLEAGVRTLPVLAVLFLPIGLGVGELYIWANPEIAEATKSIQDKQPYLNVPFFWIRAVIYFASWITLSFLLSSWSRAQDRADTPEQAQEYAARLNYLSGPGLVVFGITITFASVDWIMSLQPAFRSTIFGPLFASGELLTGFAYALVVMAWLVMRPPLAELVSTDALNDLGSLLFTFLIIWAYMTFFEFMLIWIADLPYDVLWYLPRLRGGWEWVALALVLFHFTIPFFALLLRDVKRNPRALAGLGGLILLMHLLYMYYQVLPAFPPAGLAEHWLDFVAPVGVGGLWLAAFLHDLKEGPVLPLHDLNQEAAVHYRELQEERPEVHHA